MVSRHGARLKRYLWNILIALDQVGNALLAGDPDETISSRIGKVKRGHGGRIPWKRPLLKLADWALDQVDKDHTLESIDDTEGKDQVWDWDR